MDMDALMTGTRPPYQFNSPDADVILLARPAASSDDDTPVEFHVHRNILSMASGFFEDLFSLPQPPSDEVVSGVDSDEEQECIINSINDSARRTTSSLGVGMGSGAGSSSTGMVALLGSGSTKITAGKQRGQGRDKRPVIPVPDPADALDLTLRIVYPLPQPDLSSTTLDTLTAVLNIAVKYDFTCVIQNVRKALVSPPSRFLKDSAVRVYAIACRFDLEEEMKIASRYTLSTNLLQAPFSQVSEADLRFIDGYSYARLLRLHAERVHGILGVLSGMKVDGIKCMQCNGTQYTFHGTAKWWFEWEKRAREEVGRRPLGDEIFGMEFLYRAASATGCSRCPESVLDSWRFLKDVKDRIGAVTDTV